MISTGSFLTETGASNKQSELVKKLTAAWEKKNSKTARAGGASLMALSLAACGGEDNTPFSQVDVDAAKAEGVASVDITSDNADAVTAALTGTDGTVYATVDAAVTAGAAGVDITSDNAAAKTEALTAADGTIYASVDAAYTAGSNLSNADAVAAALTGADGTVYATVDAAVTAGADSVDITTDNQAAIDAEMVGTGFADVASLLAAYNAAVAATPALTSALTSSKDDVFGTTNDDTITGTSATFTGTDVITDGSSTDNDTLTVTLSDDLSATPVVVGIENVNFVLSTLDAGGNATLTIDVADIAASTITVSASNAANIVTTADLDNVASNMVVASSIATINVATAADADITVNATGATQTVVQSGTADTLTVTGGNLTVSSTTAEEAVTITATGTVAMNEAAANAAGTDVAFTITAGDDVTITEIADTGSLTITASGGDVVVGTTDLAIDGAVTVTTAAGDITITDADDAAGALTLTAVGAGPADTSTASDGAITVTQADSATSAVLTSTDTITVSELNAATSLTMSAAAASTLDSVDALANLTIEATGAGSTAVTFTTTAGETRALETLTVTGDRDATFAMSGADIAAAKAATSEKLVATDTGTATSTLDVNASTGGALDLTGVALDVIEISADHTGAISLADDANVKVSLSQTDLSLSSAAVASQNVTVTLDHDTAGTGITLSDLSATNLSQIDIVLGDATADYVITDITTTASTDINISGGGGLTISGQTTYKSINASGVTGDVTVSVAPAAITTGSGDDSFTVNDGVATAHTITAGTGTDTIVFTASDDFSGGTLTLSGIETLNVAASGVVLAGSQVTGKGYNIVGNATSDTLAVNAAATTGETIDMAGSSVALAAVTINGNNGADVITGSATQAMTLNGGAGADTITGGAGGDTFGGGDGDDTIVTGAGTNTVDAGNGADSITGGSGTDTFQYITADDSDATDMDNIIGFNTSKDLLEFDTTGAADDNTNNDAAVVADLADQFASGVATGALATAIAADATLSDALTAFLAATGWDDNDVGGFNWGGNAYIVHADADNAAGNIVRLDGITVTEVTESGATDSFLIA